MNSWTEREVELIIQDYFKMLFAELSSLNYSKAAHRRSLLQLLNNRTEGSIEFKHQNISAVLINLGQLYIRGYLPRFNYQKILEDKVVEYLMSDQSIEKQFKAYVNKKISSLNFSKFDNVLVEAPFSSRNLFQEPSPAYSKAGVKINYLEKEQRNISLGNAGEEFILSYEKWNLLRIGKENLAKQVRWIAKEEGDGFGFDILSKNIDGTDKFIEVKTTTLGKETPFFFSRNELIFSEENSLNYHLYRLFNFENTPKLFFKNGGLNSICQSVPISFKGYF